MKNSKNNKIKQFANLKEDERLSICILSGCDYLDNSKGVGLITLISVI